MSRLRGTEAKVAWAKKHLEELDTEVSGFLKDPYRIVRKDKIKQHRHVLRFEFKPVPVSIGLLAGDFTYCLRSGLDQLAWQLARINNVARPRTATAFPIWSVNPGAGGFKDKTRDILPLAVTVIESLQPYHRGNSFKEHPLWILNELCNIDKHMLFAINSCGGTVDFPNVEVVARRELQYGFEAAVSLSDKLNVRFQPHSTKIIFGKPPSVRGEPFDVDISGLHTVYKFVQDDVIPKFAGFFSGVA